VGRCRTAHQRVSGVARPDDISRELVSRRELWQPGHRRRHLLRQARSTRARLSECRKSWPRYRPGIASVNASLSAHWETQMAALGRLIETCQRDAMALSVTLLDTTNLEALEGHAASLELAMGRCPEDLLPMVPLRHVPRLCSVSSFEDAHPERDPAPELRERVARLERSPRLMAGDRGQACVASYARALQERR